MFPSLPNSRNGNLFPNMPKRSKKQSLFPSFNRMKKINDNKETFNFISKKVKVGNFTIKDTGNVSVSGLGFKPHLVLFTYIGSTVLNGSNAHTIFSTGAMDKNGNQYAVGVFSTNNVSTSQSSKSGVSDAIIIQYNYLTLTTKASFVSMDTDGFTISIDTYSDNAIRGINYIAIGDLEAVKIGTFNTSTVTGNQTISGVGFTPDCLFLNSSLLVTGDNTASLHFLSGFSDSNLNQACHSNFDTDGQTTTDNGRGVSQNDIIYRIGFNGNIIDQAKVTQYNTDGFVLNWTLKNTVTYKYYYIALKGLTTKVDTIYSPTTVGDLEISGVGFKSQGCIVLSGGKQGTDGTVVHALNGLGFTDFTTQNNSSFFTVDNVSPTNTGRYIDKYNLLHNWVNNTSLYKGKIKNVNSDGFTFSFSETVGNAISIPYFAFTGINWNLDNIYEITINHKKIKSDLVHFPITIILNSDHSDIFTEVGSNWKKIAMADKNGNQLYVEVEQWNVSLKKATLHVSRSDFVLSRLRDTKLYLYYDSTHNDNDNYVGEANSTPAKKVWDSSFKLVYNMAQDPSGGSNCIKDSTSNANHGTPSSSMTNTDLIDGKTGKAIEFDGVDDEITFSSISLTDWTMEILCKNQNGGTAHDGYVIIDGAGIVAENGVVYALIQANDARVKSSNIIKTAIYEYVVANRTGTNYNLFINGTEDSNSVTDTGWGLTGVYKIGFGRSSAYTEMTMDCIRISSIVRSAAWIKATNASFNNTLLTIKKK